MCSGSSTICRPSSPNDPVRLAVSRSTRSEMSKPFTLKSSAHCAGVLPSFKKRLICVMAGLDRLHGQPQKPFVAE